MRNFKEMIFKRSIRFIVLAVCALGVMPTQAFAQKILENFDREPTQFELVPNEEFIKDKTLYNENTLEDESLHFSIYLPPDWKRSDGVGFSADFMNQGVFSDLAQFFGPAKIVGDRKRLTVWSQTLPYQMSARFWLIKYILSKNYTLQGVKSYGDRKVEAVYAALENGSSYAVRSVAYINSKNVIFAEYFLPLDEWDAGHIEQAQVMQSFTMNKRFDDYAEVMVEQPFLDVALIRHPESWDFEQKRIRSADRIQASLYNHRKSEQRDGTIKKHLEGEIDIEFVSKYAVGDLESEIDRFNVALNDRGLMISDFIEEREDYIFDPFIEFGETKVYQATDREKDLIDYEFWISTLGTDDYYIFVTLLTPARDHNLDIWHRNSETYKLIATHIEDLVIEE